jgi:hypothetical protein
MLESMANLYGAAGPADTSAVPGSASKKDSGRDDAARTADVVQLARRRIGTMRADLTRRHERDLADLNDRLGVAERLAKTDVRQAATMYQAIIDLHQGETWAEAIVAKARSRMAELKK